MLRLGNSLKEFTLDEIFSDPGLFIDFWKEYTKPEFYYLSFFEERGQLKLLPSDLSVEKRKQDFFNAITTLIRGFKNKLKIEGYFKDLEKKEQEKKAVEITYAYIIQFILYKTLVDNDFGKFTKEFEDITKNIQDCLKTKHYGEILGNIEGISNSISQNIYRPFIKEQEFINKTLRDLIRKPKKELHDVSPWLDIFVFIKNYNFANVKNEIFGYIYENYLKELYEDTKKGQYFTDPAIVNFMLDQVGYTKETIKRRLSNKPDDPYISIVDPSCGSGTFLYSATDQIISAVPNGSEETSKKIEEMINENVFGLDIAEFPLYLAEMNILMRMLPLILNEKYNNPIDRKIKVFKTKDSVAEFLDTEIRNTMHDLVGQQTLFSSKKLDLDYSSFMREKSDLEEMKKSLENNPKCPRRRFDFVIGNPPYVSYNECSRQRVYIVELIQQKKAMMSDIYGMNLNTVPGRIKAYAPKPNLYAFFIALGLALLKDNGKLCYIIPQTILSANDLDVARYHLAKFYTIEKIITFSGNMFIERGLKQNKTVATSSLVFVVRRATPESAHQVEIIHYRDSNEDIEKCLQNISLGRKISKRKIKQHDLMINIANWNFIKQDKGYSEFIQNYINNTIDISTFRSKLSRKDDFYFDGGAIINSKNITSVEKDSFEIFDYEKNDWNRYTVSQSYEYYPKNSELNFPGGSQGLNTFKQKYKIIWRTRFSDHFQFTDRDILLVSNQSLTVSSNSKQNLLFYFALINSPVNRRILKNNLRQENERNFFIPLRAMKTFIRVPKLTEYNQFINEEIIKKAEEMLALEDITLADLVDFSGVMIQKFDDMEVAGDNLVLEKDGKQIKCKIKKDKNLIKKTIKDISKNKKLFRDKQIILSELKSLPAIDFEKQKEIKDYIDDLIFSLYFNVPVNRVGLGKARETKRECEKNKFYKLINIPR